MNPSPMTQPDHCFKPSKPVMLAADDTSTSLFLSVTADGVPGYTRRGGGEVEGQRSIHIRVGFGNEENTSDCYIDGGGGGREDMYDDSGLSNGRRSFFEVFLEVGESVEKSGGGGTVQSVSESPDDS